MIGLGHLGEEEKGVEHWREGLVMVGGASRTEVWLYQTTDWWSVRMMSGSSSLVCRW